jgi:hypothetical protein
MLFTSLDRDQQLKACLVSDAAHILKGFDDGGEDVRPIQIAPNEIEDFGLEISGIYRQDTADVVQFDKNKRGIRASGQASAQRIIGKRTTKSLRKR